MFLFCSHISGSNYWRGQTYELGAAGGGGMRELDGHVVYVSRELDNVQGSHSDSSSSRATSGGDVQCDDVRVCRVMMDTDKDQTER
jgi:hypothetical protein